jgi:hypothetical protein
MVGALERINAQSPDHSKLPPVLFGQADRALTDADELKTTLDRIAKRPKRWWTWPVAIPTLAVTALVVAGIVIAAIQGPSLTADSLAGSLKDHRPGADLVSCSERPLFQSIWDCTVTYPVPTGCALASTPTRDPVLVAATSRPTRRGACGARAQEYEVVADSKSKCWAASDVSGDIERARNQPYEPARDPPLLLKLLKGLSSVLRSCID